MKTTENTTKKYESPEIKTIEISCEGVLCSSNEELNETQGEW